MTVRACAWAALFAWVGSGCALLQDIVRPPSVALDGARFVAADWESLRVDLHLTVHNPNTVGVRLDGYGMKLSVDGVTLLDGDIDEPLDLRGGATADLVLPALVRWAELGQRVLGATAAPTELPYSVQGHLRFTTPLGALDLPFEDRGRIPVLRPPSVRPVAIRVEESSLNALRLALDVDISKGPGQPMSLTAFTHDVTMNGRSVFRGALEGPVEIAGVQAQRRTLRVDVSLREVTAALASALLGGAHIDVGLNCQATVHTAYGPLPWRFQRDRRLPLTR